MRPWLSASVSVAPRLTGQAAMRAQVPHIVPIIILDSARGGQAVTGALGRGWAWVVAAVPRSKKVCN